MIAEIVPCKVNGLGVFAIVGRWRWKLDYSTIDILNIRLIVIQRMLEVNASHGRRESVVDEYIKVGRINKSKTNKQI